MRLGTLACSTLLAVLACSGEKDLPKSGGSKTVAPIEIVPDVDTRPLPVGTTSPKVFAFVWDVNGFDKVAELAKKSDWTAVRELCDKALKNPNHLEGHFWMAQALSQSGDFGKAFEHLKHALSGDWLRYSPLLATTPTLEPLLKNAIGEKLSALNLQIGEDFKKRMARGLWLVGRRGTYRAPDKTGVQRASPRAEVFVYDRETNRYLRITHTDFNVAGFVLAPNRNELAYLTYDKIELPTGAGAPAVAPTPAELTASDQPEPPTPSTDTAPAAAGSTNTASARFARASVGVQTLTEVGSEPVQAKLTKAVANVEIGYAAGDELIVKIQEAANGVAQTFSFDKATAKLLPRSDGELSSGVWFSPESIKRTKQRSKVDGITADWSGEPASSDEFVFAKSQRRVTLPVGRAARQDSFVWSPSSDVVVFATADQYCISAGAAQPGALYLAHADSGQLLHVGPLADPHHVSFVDNVTIAFDDGQGNVRLFDVVQGRVLAQLSDTQNSVVGLSAQLQPACRQP